MTSIASLQNQVSDIGADIRLTDIFDLAELQQLQEIFSEAHNVASIITHPDGTPITQPSNFCRLCKDIIRKTPEGCKNCYKSDAIIGRQNTTGPTIQRCLSCGLWDAGVSINIGGRHIANWLIGQVRNNELNHTDIASYAQAIGADTELFMEAYQDVPVMSVEQFSKVSRMLFVYVNTLSANAYHNIRLKKEIEEREKAYHMLQKSEELLFITLQSIGDGVISTDNRGCVVSMNPVAERLCGWTNDEARGRHLAEIFRIVNVKTRLEVQNPVYEVLENGKTVGLANHTVLISRDGSEYHIADSAAPIRDAGGAINGVVLVFSDVTAEYEAGEKQRESERSKSVLFANLPGMAYRCKNDANWTMEFISEGCFDLTGYRETDFIGNNKTAFNDIIHPDFREAIRNNWERSMQQQERISDEYKIITAGGLEKWVWDQGSPIYDENKNVVALEGLILDITERKQMENALREKEYYLSQTQAIARLGSYTYNIATGYCTTSPLLDEIFGFGPGFEKSKSALLSVVHPNWQNDMESYVKNEVLGQKMKFDKTFRIIRQSDQEERWVHVMGELFLDVNNHPATLIGIVQDITDQKNATEALQKSEILHRSILSASPDAIVVVDTNCIIRMVSPMARAIYQCKDENELIGRNMYDFLPAEEKERARQNNKRRFEGNVGTVEYQIVKSNGDIMYAEVNGDVLHSPQGDPSGMVFVMRDVTSLKKSERALRSSQEQLKKYASHLQHVREEERLILAREIHDELGQILIALKIDIGMLKQNVLKNIKDNACDDILIKFDNIFGLVDATIHTTRKIMTDLRPELLHLLGFIEAVKFQASKFEERHKICCTFECNLNQLKLNPQQSVALFRIYQEAMSNVARHSKASHVKVKLYETDEKIVVEITDNGIGLSACQKIRPDSYGIIGMKERTFLLNGHIYISGQSGHGTSVKVEIPVGCQE